MNEIKTDMVLKSGRTGAIEVHMKEHEWFNCYSNGWSQNDITPAAFSHPAKFAKGLIQRIYDHLLTEGYVRAGDKIADPFGGVALGALFAMRNGLHWAGVELEERFVELGNENIALWNGRFAPHFPGWGTARLIQGDSRRLVEILGGAGCVVGSPPYSVEALGHSRGRAGEKREATGKYKQGYTAGEIIADAYGRSPGQLGNMPEGSHTAVITSPPFSPPGNQPTGRGQGVREDYRNGTRKEDMPESNYGGSNGQLGSMPMTDFDAIITSPAYGDSVNGVGEGPGARFDPVYHNGENATKKSSSNGYGVTDGQLGRMGAVVGSPPFETTNQSIDSDFLQKRAEQHLNGSRMQPGLGTYGKSEGQLGQETGCDFWSAAKIILSQCCQILQPGGVAVWVTGDYVRDSKRVEFGRQWLQLCESVGFIPLEHITAWKREPGPVQTGIFGDDKDLAIHRVSFFRRLANDKANARLHWETVENKEGYLGTAEADLWDAYAADPERQKKPTKNRILGNARLIAWRADGGPVYDDSAAILNEDVWIVQKPLFAANGRAKEPTL